MFQHQCIKPGCGTTYTDEDVDPYYCPACNAARLSIAGALDAKFNTVGQQPSSALQEYDKARGGGRFPTAGALGIDI